MVNKLFIQSKRLHIILLAGRVLLGYSGCYTSSGRLLRRRATRGGTIMRGLLPLPHHKPKRVPFGDPVFWTHNDPYALSFGYSYHNAHGGRRQYPTHFLTLHPQNAISNILRGDSGDLYRILMQSFSIFCFIYVTFQIRIFWC